MATPIKDIPFLTGKAARRFEKIIKKNETRRISQESYERIMKAGENVRIFDSFTEYENFLNASSTDD